MELIFLRKDMQKAKNVVINPHKSVAVDTILPKKAKPIHQIVDKRLAEN